MADEAVAQISKDFNVSAKCANYMYYRVRRSLSRKSPQYLAWTLALQNALVRADKCLLNWDDLIFGEEIPILAANGIHLEKSNEVFRWPSPDGETGRCVESFVDSAVEPDDNWSIVRNRKPAKNKLGMWID